MSKAFIGTVTYHVLVTQDAKMTRKCRWWQGMRAAVVVPTMKS